MERSLESSTKSSSDSSEARAFTFSTSSNLAAPKSKITQEWQRNPNSTNEGRGDQLLPAILPENADLAILESTTQSDEGPRKYKTSTQLLCHGRTKHCRSETRNFSEGRLSTLSLHGTLPQTSIEPQSPFHDEIASPSSIWHSNAPPQTAVFNSFKHSSDLRWSLQGLGL